MRGSVQTGTIWTHQSQPPNESTASRGLNSAVAQAITAASADVLIQHRNGAYTSLTFAYDELK